MKPCLYQTVLVIEDSPTRQSYKCGQTTKKQIIYNNSAAVIA